MVVLAAERCVSTNAASAVMFTTSDTAANCKAMGNSARWPTVTVTACATDLANPGASTVTWYVPGGKDRNWYLPSRLTLVDRTKLRAGLLTVTVALLSKAPFGSLTVTCNSAVDGASSASTRTSHAVAFIVPSSPCSAAAGVQALDPVPVRPMGLGGRFAIS